MSIEQCHGKSVKISPETLPKVQETSNVEELKLDDVQEEPSLASPLTRVRRGGGYGYGYNNYGGYGGGSWTAYCCNYGYGISPGCKYNGFWNARNNPYCY